MGPICEKMALLTAGRASRRGITNGRNAPGPADVALILENYVQPVERYVTPQEAISDVQKLVVVGWKGPMDSRAYSE